VGGFQYELTQRVSSCIGENSQGPIVIDHYDDDEGQNAGVGRESITNCTMDWSVFQDVDNAEGSPCEGMAAEGGVALISASVEHLAPRGAYDRQ